MPTGKTPSPALNVVTSQRTVQPWEVATMLRKHGCPKKWLVVMTAIAGPESGYHVDPVDKTGLDPHPLGLFQIYNHPQYNQERLRTDPDYNTQAAVAVLNGAGSPKPWETYTNGAYQSYMADARAAVIKSQQTVKPQNLSSWNVNSDDISAAHETAGAVGLGGAYTAVQSTGSAVGDVAGVLTNPDTWVRAGQIIGGLVLAVVGFVLLARTVGAPRLNVNLPSMSTEKVENKSTENGEKSTEKVENGNSES